MADDGYFLRARLRVSLPGMDRATAEMLVAEADSVCPYSRAVRGNIDTTVTLV